MIRVFLNHHFASFRWGTQKDQTKGAFQTNRFLNIQVFISLFLLRNWRYLHQKKKKLSGDLTIASHIQDFKIILCPGKPLVPTQLTPVFNLMLENRKYRFRTSQSPSFPTCFFVLLLSEMHCFWPLSVLWFFSMSSQLHFFLHSFCVISALLAALTSNTTPGD